MTILGMDLGTFVALLAGVALIITAVVVFVVTLSFPVGGLGITLVGLVLITVSQWSKIKLSGEGLELERRLTTVERSVQTVEQSVRRVQADVNQTTQAASIVATQAQAAAQAVDTTNRQLVELTRVLESRQAVPPSSAQSIYRELKTAPRVDINKLKGASEALQKAK